jgi:uncharacterized OB-fold protein
VSARLEPPVTEITAPFWESTQRKELVLQWCNACGAVIHYPRALCPSCLADDLEFRTASGKGTIYAFTVVHRAGNPTMETRVPYVVALVELEEGTRMLSNVVGCEPREVRVGMPVQVSWEELSDGRALPLFEPIQ